MLTITHTFTARDFEVQARYYMATALARTPYAKMRWPFRIALYICSLIFLIMGIGLLCDKNWGALIYLGVGLMPIFRIIFLKLLVWHTLAKVRQEAQSKVGSSAKWDVDDNGIVSMGERFPWSMFQSFTMGDTGIFLEGSHLLWIPADAVADSITKIALREILCRHIKELT